MRVEGGQRGRGLLRHRGRGRSAPTDSAAPYGRCTPAPRAASRAIRSRPRAPRSRGRVATSTRPWAGLTPAVPWRWRLRTPRRSGRRFPTATRRGASLEAARSASTTAHRPHPPRCDDQGQDQDEPDEGGEQTQADDRPDRPRRRCGERCGECPFLAGPASRPQRLRPYIDDVSHAGHSIPPVADIPSSSITVPGVGGLGAGGVPRVSSCRRWGAPTARGRR